jgi:hypothetical protein
MPQPTTVTEFIRLANELANEFYTFHGHISRPAFAFSMATHPQERLCYAMASEALKVLTRNPARHRSDKAIVTQTNKLADKFYTMMGHISRPSFDFHAATHPEEALCWRMASEAQLTITDTDVDDALSNLEV